MIYKVITDQYSL